MTHVQRGLDGVVAWSSLNHMVAQLRTKCLLLIQKLHNHPFPCHMSFERLFPKSRDKGGKIGVHLVWSVTEVSPRAVGKYRGIRASHPGPGNSTQGPGDWWLVGVIYCWPGGEVTGHLVYCCT